MDAVEIDFSDMLVEDQNCGAMSYIDRKSMCMYSISELNIPVPDLCFVHKQINAAVSSRCFKLETPADELDSFS